MYIVVFEKRRHLLRCFAKRFEFSGLRMSWYVALEKL